MNLKTLYGITISAQINTYSTQGHLTTWACDTHLFFDRREGAGESRGEFTGVFCVVNDIIEANSALHACSSADKIKLVVINYPK